MEETVDCPECGLRYDSNQNAFCPRCGSEHHGPAPKPTLALADRATPGRRRVQIGGIILIAIAALALIQFTIAAFDTSPPDDATLDMLSDVELMRAAPGGTLELLAPPGNYTLQTMDGSPLANGTTDGPVTLGLDSTFTNLTITTDAGAITRFLYIPDDEHHVLNLTQDTDPGPTWVAVGTVGAMQAVAGFLAFFSALVVLGGIMAVRLRYKALAFMACGLAITPGLLMLVLAPAAGALLLLLPAVATGLIVAGRRHFA